MSNPVNLQEQLLAAQAAENTNNPFVATPDSDGEDEVTIEHARWLHGAVNDLNQRNAALEAQLAALQAIEQRIADIETRGGGPRPAAKRHVKVGKPLRFDGTRRDELQGFIT